MFSRDGGVRKIDSEVRIWRLNIWIRHRNRLDSKFLTPNPALCPSRPCFYTHAIYTLPYKFLNPDPAPVFSKTSNQDPNADLKNVAELLQLNFTQVTTSF